MGVLEELPIFWAEIAVSRKESRELDSALNQYEVALFFFKFYLVFLGASCFFFNLFC